MACDARRAAGDLKNERTVKRGATTRNLSQGKYLYACPELAERDGGHIIAEYDGNNSLLHKYIYGPGVDQPICMIDVEHSSATYYYHFDALGSVVALSNASGSTVEVYEYSVYGQVGASDPNHMNLFMFTGRELDKESGLYYYRARYYNPEIGRFMQTDPVGYIAGMNLYRYCHNNPVNSTDPLGLMDSKDGNDGNDGNDSNDYNDSAPPAPPAPCSGSSCCSSSSSPASSISAMSVSAEYSVKRPSKKSGPFCTAWKNCRGEPTRHPHDPTGEVLSNKLAMCIACCGEQFPPGVFGSLPLPGWPKAHAKWQRCQTLCAATDGKFGPSW